MRQVFIHKGDSLKALFEDQIACIPVALCSRKSVVQKYHDLVPLLQGRDMFLLQRDKDSAVYFGLVSGTSLTDLDKNPYITHTDTFANALTKITNTDDMEDADLAVSIQFDTMTKEEVMRYFTLGFLDILVMEHHIDLKVTDLVLCDYKKDGFLTRLNLPLQEVLKRTAHCPRNREGALFISYNFTVS
jgi:hypothetical protein